MSPCFTKKETSGIARSNWDVALPGSIAPSRHVTASRKSTVTSSFARPIQSLRIIVKPNVDAPRLNIAQSWAIASVKPTKPTFGSNVWVRTASFLSRALQPSKPKSANSSPSSSPFSASADSTFNPSAL